MKSYGPINRQMRAKMVTTTWKRTLQVYSISNGLIMAQTIHLAVLSWLVCMLQVNLQVDIDPFYLHGCQCKFCEKANFKKHTVDLVPSAYTFKQTF